MKKNLPQFKGNLPSVYLAGFSVLVIIALVLTSFFFWDEYFSQVIKQKKANLGSLVSRTLKKEKAEDLEVSLGFESQDQPFAVGQEFKLAVILDSQEKEVWGADLKLSFNPQSLKVKKISAGKYFQKPLVLDESISQEGEVSFSVGSLASVEGKDSLAILIIEPLKKGGVSFSFSQKTQVALKGKEKPALINYHHFSSLVSK